ncbi:MAG: acylneuraminate cytidylyltransferase family protein [Tissierellia bacterium]|nr:acylneuraminate cytidylyltransferase family protein [Tissierellia bacterium]
MYKGKSILAIIPARGGSKGIPRKNIRNMAGMPLMAWSIEAGRRSKYIDRIIVSTEDREIMDIALKYGAEVPFLRPNELAQDNTPGVEPVLYTVKKLINDENNKYDYTILLQPTSPLRNEKHIDEAIETLLSINNIKKFNSLISVTEVEHPVYWNRLIGANNELKDFLKYDKSIKFRRQHFNNVYRLNGAIYLIETDALLKYMNFETDNTMAYKMDKKSTIDIDCIDDFELAEFYIEKKISR